MKDKRFFILNTHYQTLPIISRAQQQALSANGLPGQQAILDFNLKVRQFEQQDPQIGQMSSEIRSYILPALQWTSSFFFTFLFLCSVRKPINWIRKLTIKTVNKKNVVFGARNFKVVVKNTWRLQNIIADRGPESLHQTYIGRYSNNYFWRSAK